MLLTICLELYITVALLFLAGKDASSYRMKDHSGRNEVLQKKRIKRWHRDGVALFILFVIPCVYFTNNYWLILYAALIRLTFFDPAFNHWAGLRVRYLGSTAIWDKFFISIFGLNGALLKSLVFLVILILTNILVMSPKTITTLFGLLTIN